MEKILGISLLVLGFLIFYVPFKLNQWYIKDTEREIEDLKKENEKLSQIKSVEAQEQIQKNQRKINNLETNLAVNRY